MVYVLLIVNVDLWNVNKILYHIILILKLIFYLCSMNPH